MRLSAAALLALLLSTTGCTGTSGSDDTSSGGSASTSSSPSPSSTQSPESSPSVSRSQASISKDDVQLTLRETQKNCFQGSGCFVDFKILPRLRSGVSGLDGDYAVTYEITGGQGAPGKNNVVLHRDRTFGSTDPGTVQTASKDARLQVRVVSIAPNAQ